MAVERNQGQANYDEMVNRPISTRNTLADAENDYARDYSDLNTDYSAGSTAQKPKTGLASLEDQASAAQNELTESAATGDMATREREASFETSGFDAQQGRSSASGTASGTAGNSNLSRRLARDIILIVGGCGVLLTGFNAVSGPLQIVQASSLISDFATNIIDNQQSSRSMNTIGNVVHKAMGGNVRKSRMGLLGEHQADQAAKRLKENGVEFDDAGNMHIDSAKSKALASSDDLTPEKLSSTLGVKESKIHVSEGGEVTIDKGLSWREGRNALSSLDDPTAGKLTSWLQRRKLMKREGMTSWLHPLQKAENFASDKFGDFLSKFFKKINTKDGKNKDGDISEADKDDIEESSSGDEAGTEGGGSSTDGDDASSALHKSESDVKSELKSHDYDPIKNNGIRGKFKRISDSKIGQFASSKGVGLASMIANLLCTFHQFAANIGATKWVNIVAPAMKFAASVQGVGSQIKSGEDISLNNVSNSTRMMMYDDQLHYIGDDGKATDETFTSSFWDSKPVCAELGLTNCQGDESVPDALKTAASGLHITGIQSIDDSLTTFLDGGQLSSVLDAACFILPGLGDIFDIISDFGTLGAKTAIDAAVAVGSGFAVGFVMYEIQKYTTGSILNAARLLPAEWGSAVMYGGKFSAISQSLTMGSRKLTSAEAMELKLDNRRFLAWQNSKKSVLARLADPSDYNSAINQVARAVRINPARQDLITQLANVGKALTAAPTMLATASGQIFGGSAYAASNYDYGVNDWAWGSAELDSYVNTNQFDNADYVFSKLDAEAEAAKGIKTALNDAKNSQLGNLIDDARKGANGAIEAINGALNGICVDGWCLSDASPIQTIDGIKDLDEYSNPDKTPLHYYAKQCLAVKISDDDSHKVEAIDNSDGSAWNFRDNASDQTPVDAACQNLAGQGDVQKLRLYVMDYFNTVSSACYNGDADDQTSADACKEMHADKGSSNSDSGSSSGAAMGDLAQKAIQRAQAVIGSVYSPSGYRWTGSTAGSYFTCSGLVDYALGYGSQAHTPESYAAATGMSKSPDQLQPGDLTYYSYAGRYPGHVEIYIGNGQTIGAWPNGGVQVHGVLDAGPYLGGGTFTQPGELIDQPFSTPAGRL